MPNLDVKVLRYMSNEEFRVLTAVEMGMKNHEIVPSSLIESISGLKRGGAFKLIRLLAKNKLVGHQSKPYDGYRLTSKGYDYLALKTLCKRGAISAVGIQIGVGKESDIFTAVRPDGEEVALKLHKLGRSFRTLKNNRDYTRPGQSFNWLYMSRLSALKEFAFMSALHSKGFSVPTPIDVNRHVVVMSLAHGYQLNSIQMLRHPSSVFNSLMELVCSLASYGLIHCDFNEFNMLVDDSENVTLIDFPQMISTSHTNADYYFNRDVECVRAFFRRRFGFVAAQVPTLDRDTSRNEHALDEQLAASGWTPAQETEFAALADALAQETAESAEHAGAPESGSEAGEGLGSDGEDGETSSSTDRDYSDEEDAETMGLGRGQLGGTRCSDGVSNSNGGAAGGVECATLGTEDVEEIAVQVEKSLRAGAMAESYEQAPAGVSTSSHSTSGSATGGVHGGGAPGDKERSTAGALSSGQGREAHEQTHLACATTSEDEGAAGLWQPGHNRSQPVHQGQSQTAGDAPRDEEALRRGSGRATASGANARVAERVKQELRRKHSLRQPKGGSRNEGKNRDQRKLAASVRREVDGSGGW